MKLMLAAALVASASACATGQRPDRASGIFADCADCPDLVVVPAGTFSMGAPLSETGRFEDEGPVHPVVIARDLAVMRTPVTVAQFARYAKETGRTPAAGCNAWDAEGEWRMAPALSWQAPGFPQGPNHPVVCVSWEEGQQFANWLSAKTGRRYRFLSEAEFEYVARAGSVAAYPWGADGSRFCSHANGFDQVAARANPKWGKADCDDGHAFTSPVGSFPANAFGLLDTTGNAFQWVEDCFVKGGYEGAPADGSARKEPNCRIRAIRGGAWTNGPRGLRSAMRDRDPQDSRYNNISLRLARDLP